MSETLMPRWQRAATGSALAAAALLGPSACSLGTSMPDAAFSSCLDSPPFERPQLPAPTDPKYEEIQKNWYKYHPAYEEPITLHYDRVGEKFEEAPVVTPEIKEQLKHANVQIDHGDSKGSGFATLAPDNSVIVVTAAHAVAHSEMEDITVTDHTGKEAKIASGCLSLYDQNGTKLDSDPEIAAEIDFAILRLTGPLNAKPVKIAEKFPDRGGWGIFVNNQKFHTPDKPAMYPGLVTSNSYRGPLGGYVAVTGLDPGARKMGFDTYAKPGCSGGIVADPETGEIIGISTTAEERSNSNDAVKAMFNLILAGAPLAGGSSGLEPRTSRMTPAEILNTAIAAKKYYKREDLDSTALRHSLATPLPAAQTAMRSTQRSSTHASGHRNTKNIRRRYV